MSFLAPKTENPLSMRKLMFGTNSEALFQSAIFCVVSSPGLTPRAIMRFPFQGIRKDDKEKSHSEFDRFQHNKTLNPMLYCENLSFKLSFIEVPKTMKRTTFKTHGLA